MFAVSSKGPAHLVTLYIISKVHWGTTLTRVSTKVAFLNVETLVIMFAEKIFVDAYKRHVALLLERSIFIQFTYIYISTAAVS